MITASENSQNSLRSIGRSARFKKNLPNDHPSQTESGRSIQM